MVDNDVNLMALGEQHAGVARTVHDFLVVKIGTGIGCGIVVPR
jgi:predicted NBD/HSP70 family sugar kinase